VRDFHPQLGAFLAAQGIGTLGSSLFLAEVPQTVTGTAVLVQETPGPVPLPGRGVVLRAQVTALAADPETARGLAWDVYDLLDGKGPMQIGTEAVTFIRALQRPFLLQRDGQRWRYVVNLEFRFGGP